MLSLLLHALVIGLILWPATRFLTINDPGNPLLAPGGGGGGGGGGGETVAYISLPAFTPPPEAPEVVDVPIVETPEVPVVPEPQPVRDSAVPDTVVVAANIGATRGVGTGSAGTGTGEGPGEGGGTGEGSGPGSGPGSGGGMSLARNPYWTQAILPPENPPRELRGKTIEILFWIKADGRVERVEFNPEIENRGFATKFRERLLDFVFSPARSATGAAIAVQYPISITF